MSEVSLSGVFLYMCGIKKNQLRASRRSAYVLTSNHSIDDLLIITEHAIDRILPPTFCTFPHAFFMCKNLFLLSTTRHTLADVLSGSGG